MSHSFRSCCCTIAVLSGLLGPTARADVFGDVFVGLDFAGFQTTGQRNPLSQGFDITTQRNFQNTLLDFGATELLLTGPVASPSSSDEPTDAWRFLPLGLELLARECVDDDALVETFGYGNRVSAVAFLMGLSREDLRDKDLEPYDPLCPLIAALRVTKAG